MKDDRLYLLHILECVKRIEAYTTGGRDEFMQDTRTQDAVVRNFEIVGEAAKRISQATRDLAPDIPWRRLGGFRDILIHQYEGVDVHEVWQIVEGDLSRLRDALRELVQRMGADGVGAADEQ